jgi:hypothetical protein
MVELSPIEEAYLELQDLVCEQILISRSFAGRVLDVGGPELLAIAGLEFAQLLRQSIEGLALVVLRTESDRSKE